MIQNPSVMSLHRISRRYSRCWPLPGCFPTEMHEKWLLEFWFLVHFMGLGNIKSLPENKFFHVPTFFKPSLTLEQLRPRSEGKLLCYYKTPYFEATCPGYPRDYINSAKDFNQFNLKVLAIHSFIAEQASSLQCFHRTHRRISHFVSTRIHHFATYSIDVAGNSLYPFRPMPVCFSHPMLSISGWKLRTYKCWLASLILRTIFKSTVAFLKNKSNQREIGIVDEIRST